jgi:hypothetical protein
LSHKLKENDSSVQWNSGNFDGGKSMTMQEISDHFSRRSKNQPPKLDHMGASILSSTNNRFPNNTLGIKPSHRTNSSINIVPD